MPTHDVTPSQRSTLVSVRELADSPDSACIRLQPRPAPTGVRRCAVCTRPPSRCHPCTSGPRPVRHQIGFQWPSSAARSGRIRPMAWVHGFAQWRHEWWPMTVPAASTPPDSGGCSVGWGTGPAAVLDGGFQAWADQSMPISTDQAHPQAVDYRPGSTTAWTWIQCLSCVTCSNATPCLWTRVAPIDMRVATERWIPSPGTYRAR